MSVPNALNVLVYLMLGFSIAAFIFSFLVNKK